VLAAADPAQPYGAAVAWPARAAGRASRTAGAHVVLVDGRAILFVERKGRSLLPLCEPDDDAVGTAVAALGEALATTGRLAVERFDGAGVLGSPIEDRLLAAGFRAGPRRLTLG
jgi:ATP-dependent helicase Lhr and Lhr-like helicase